MRLLIAGLLVRVQSGERVGGASCSRNARTGGLCRMSAQGAEPPETPRKPFVVGWLGWAAGFERPGRGWRAVRTQVANRLVARTVRRLSVGVPRPAATTVATTARCTAGYGRPWAWRCWAPRQLLSPPESGEPRTRRYGRPISRCLRISSVQQGNDGRDGNRRSLNRENAVRIRPFMVRP